MWILSHRRPLGGRDCPHIRPKRKRPTRHRRHRVSLDPRTGCFGSFVWWRGREGCGGWVSHGCYFDGWDGQDVWCRLGWASRRQRYRRSRYPRPGFWYLIVCDGHRVWTVPHSRPLVGRHGQDVRTQRERPTRPQRHDTTQHPRPGFWNFVVGDGRGVWSISYCRPFGGRHGPDVWAQYRRTTRRERYDAKKHPRSGFWNFVECDCNCVWRVPYCRPFGGRHGQNVRTQ